MAKTGKRELLLGLVLIGIFTIFTWLVQTIDVQPLGVNGTDVGFATLNCIVHRLCGVHMILYTVTDWAGLVPIVAAASLGIVGLAQLMQRKRFIKVDMDILILGVYYMVVVALYLIFEKIPINFRPILINGVAETSYPSSTTLLVLSVMPTLADQIRRRCKINPIKTTATVMITCFSFLMVVGRLVSGVHWFTDILGSVVLSAGLFQIYKGLVLLLDKKIRSEG